MGKDVWVHYVFEFLLERHIFIALPYPLWHLLCFFLLPWRFKTSCATDSVTSSHPSIWQSCRTYSSITYRSQMWPTVTFEKVHFRSLHTFLLHPYNYIVRYLKPFMDIKLLILWIDNLSLPCNYSLEQYCEFLQIAHFYKKMEACLGDQNGRSKTKYSIHV